MVASGVMPISLSARFMPAVVLLSSRASSSASAKLRRSACSASSQAFSEVACAAYHAGPFVVRCGAGAVTSCGTLFVSRPMIEIRPGIVLSRSRSPFVQVRVASPAPSACGLVAARRRGPSCEGDQDERKFEVAQHCRAPVTSLAAVGTARTFSERSCRAT